MEIHATHFPVNTELLVVSKNKRNKTIYERYCRVNFINKENIPNINENTNKYYCLCKSRSNKTIDFESCARK